MTMDSSNKLDIGAKHGRDFRRTILIVDDEPVNLRILGNILGDEYDIDFATSADEAISIIQTEKDAISLVLLDLHMPGKSGFAVLDAMRVDKDLHNIPVVVVTTDKDAEVESLHRGAVDFLGKPYDKPEVIKARVGRAIELFIDKTIIGATGIDRLTGLMTRDFFVQYCHEYDKYHPEQQVDAVVVNFIKFHLINDLYGRVFGDTVLKSMAEGVRTVARAYGGVACRHNADSFYLYIEHQKDYDYLKKTILDKLGEVMNNINAKLRIGVYPDLYRSCTLQQRFDRALQACNTISRNAHNTEVAIYNNEMHEKELYEERLLRDVDEALLNNQISVVFQPKYDISGQRPVLCSAEALIRWKHPKFGFVSPDFFIPLFEENGHIKEIDRYVWRESARQIRRWREIYGVTVHVSVNVSSAEIFDPDLLEFLNGIVKENGLENSDLSLEITESSYTDSVSGIVEVVKNIRSHGFKVAMDDFGKGYSSLNMLTNLPIDSLKLDMAFIKDISPDNKEMHMVEFVLRMAEFLKVPVIAEGVDTYEQFALLKEAGCNIIQGYYFSKPLTAGEFGKLIERSCHDN
ncbi:two-component system response regulator [Butyrivibrio sp. VCB2001]|uniref:two-component system response regulator n=1 Tax=Butyrivibrio sp. VCB2001 TaxID=1280667 RepID=UPI000402A41C|nr:EAL domain-containing protein [Butyrivibrio sp. VCB2001]